MTRAIDTNVLVRLMIGDDDRQTAIARSIVDEDFVIPATVLLETEWVLRSSYGLSHAILVAMLRMIVDLPHAIDAPPNIRWAIDQMEQGADFADMIHVATAAGADRFATFDKKLPRGAGTESPIPIEALG